MMREQQTMIVQQQATIAELRQEHKESMKEQASKLDAIIAT
jgi:hypothetical protein